MMKDFFSKKIVFISFMLHILCCGLPLLAVTLSSVALLTESQISIFYNIHTFHLPILVLAVVSVCLSVFIQIQKTYKNKNLKPWQVKGFGLTCLSVALLIFDFLWLYFEPHITHFSHF